MNCKKVSIDLNDLLEKAFVAGFCASYEGYNGEYPFDCDDHRIRRELYPDMRDAIFEILSDVGVVK